MQVLRIRLAPSVALLCLAAAQEAPARPTQSAQPNVVILIADDLGYADLGCYGAPLIATPRLDGMAADGAKLTSFYVQPSCSPTRAAILTGSHPQRVGVPLPVGQWGETGLNGVETTIAEMMRAEGYATGYFGKWHLGDSPDQLPKAQGFDDVLANPWGHLADPSAYIDSQASVWEWEPDQRFDTQRFTERTLSFIDSAVAAQEPFLCILSYNAPHFPASASPAFEGISADGREYGDSVEEIDASVGSVLDRIDSLGIGEDTLVVFLSDNGPFLSSGSYQAGSAGELRGSKASTFEGGMRVPFIARWTNKIPAGSVIDDIAAGLDFMPTLAGISGGTLPAVTLDGEDMMPVLLGQGAAPNRALYYVYNGTVNGVRVGPWKLHEGELYNLVMDPGETVDLAATDPSLVASFQAMIDGYAQSLGSDSRPAGLRSHVVSDWGASAGFSGGSPLEDGDTWREGTQPFRRWVVNDSDATADFVRRPRVGPAPTDVPNSVLRQSTPNADLYLSSTTVQLPEGGPFTVELWSRSTESSPSTPIVLLDVGDENAGLSITVGDGGRLGDDAAPGRADDLRVRLGGQLSLASTTLTVDLPNDWTDQVLQIAVTYEPGGDLILYVQSLEAGRVSGETGELTGVLWGAQAEWTLFGRQGQLGGDGGSGERPFPAVSGLGDLASFGLRDRALTRSEVQRLYSRMYQYDYCAGRTNSVGKRGDLEMFGSFLLTDEALSIRVTELPAATFGFLVSSSIQARAPVSNGFICINNPIFRLAGQVPLTDMDGTAGFVVDRSLAPPQLGLEGAASLNFQFWYRDGAGSNFTNAVNVSFSP